MQPQGHTQVTIALVDDELDPQAALDRPRFCLEDGATAGRVAIEDGIPRNVSDALQAMGHSVRLAQGYERSIFGRGQIILWDKVHDSFWAGSDPRADGCAMTLI